MRRFVTASSLRRVSGVQSPAMKISKAAAAASTVGVLLIGGGSTAAAALSGGSAASGRVPPQVQSALKVATEGSGDSWSYAGTVSGHRQCWQLTGHNGELALFACADGLWLGHYRSVALTRLP